jgi:hypothetical protein
MPSRVIASKQSRDFVASIAAGGRIRLRTPLPVSVGSALFSAKRIPIPSLLELAREHERFDLTKEFYHKRARAVSVRAGV